MYCKYCGAELEPETSVCPACGKENGEEIPEMKPKAEKQKMIVHIIACVLLFVTLAAIVFVGAGGSFESIAKLFRKRENDIYYKESYTVADNKIDPDTVVATVGNHTLTNGQLQIFYWTQVYEFIEYTGGYPSYYGLDISKPLNEQILDEETGLTWQQYFVENALLSWRRYTVLCDKAEDAGYELPEDYQTTLDELEKTLLEQAQERELDSVLTMLSKDMGAGTTLENYKAYLTTYYLGNCYFSDLAENVEITQAEIEAFFAENGAELEDSYGITKEMGNMSNVRHLLVKPKGGTVGEDNTTTYSDAEWEACRQAAQALLDQWLAGEATEESFAKLATEKTEDTASAESGGLIPNVYQTGEYVEAFENWCIDTNRKAGDYGLVKTPYGYHIMYCVSSYTIWIDYSRDCILNERTTAMLKVMDEENPMEVSYKNIAIAAVTLGSN